MHRLSVLVLIIFVCAGDRGVLVLRSLVGSRGAAVIPLQIVFLVSG